MATPNPCQNLQDMIVTSVEICFNELGAKNLELIKEMALWATVLTFTGFGR